jgi:MFS family permease
LSPASDDRTRRFFVSDRLLGVLIGLTALGMDMFLPSVPAIAQAFDAEPGLAQLAVTTYLLGSLPGSSRGDRSPTGSAASRCCSPRWACSSFERSVRRGGVPDERRVAALCAGAGDVERAGDRTLRGARSRRARRAHSCSAG